MRVRFWVLQFAVMTTIVCTGFGGTAAQATGRGLADSDIAEAMVATTEDGVTNDIRELAEQQRDKALIKVSSDLLYPEFPHPTVYVTWGGDDPISYYLENSFLRLGRWWFDCGRLLAICVALVSFVTFYAQVKCGVPRSSSAARFNRRTFFATLYTSTFFFGLIIGSVFCNIAPRGGLLIALSRSLSAALALFRT